MAEGFQEDQQTISAWGEATFGPVTTPSVLIERARLEFDELAEAVTDGDADAVGAEIADVLILLYRVATLFERDIDQSVAAKMRINRDRQWIPKGDGTGRHRTD